ncbi:hypothetical protein JXM67_07660 [candidate division WOR-3 bacterium]|nr:hypothetical protein [candidate division WOR-3 bacterium]
MLNAGLFALVLCGGIITGPFRVAETEPGHHQVGIQAATAADGRFAIAWLDSLRIPESHPKIDLYIRFFDKDGNPLTDPCKVAKPSDTSWVYFPSLSMDSAGNAALVWLERPTVLAGDSPADIYMESFLPDGTPAGDTLALYTDVNIGYPASASLGNNDEFALAFVTTLDSESGVWVRRFDIEGAPQDKAFLALDPYGSFPSDPPRPRFPGIAVNDEGDVLVTWQDAYESAHMYPMFQVFDADDEPVLSWEPKGRRLDEGADLVGACRPEPCWIDNDRFAAFWTDNFLPPYLPVPLAGRVFTRKGATGHPVRTLEADSLWSNSQDPTGKFYAAVLPDGRFAFTHFRLYSYTPDTTNPFYAVTWDHAGGFLGRVSGDEPLRTTSVFEYSAPLGADTLFTTWSDEGSPYGRVPHFNTPPAVAASNDRIVWAYPRFNTDTIFEVWVVVSDWDMGVGTDEKPVVKEQGDWQVDRTVGKRIAMSYSNSPQGFSASVFDASGRKVDELRSPTPSGVLFWGEDQSAGVYFIRSENYACSVRKVALVR